MVKSCAKRDCATIKSEFQLDDRLAQKIKNTRKAARLARRKTGSCGPVFVQKHYQSAFKAGTISVGMHLVKTARGIG